MDEKERVLQRQIGNRLQHARIMQGLTQKELGDALGVTFQQIQKYEKGSNNISLSKLFTAANILGVTVNYFYDAPDAFAHEQPPMRRKLLHLIQSLKRIEQQNPEAFLAICTMTAKLAPKQKP